MRLLALDLALAKTGWALLADDHLETYGVITTHPQAQAWERIVELRGKVASTINRARATAVALEVTDWAPGARDERSAWIRESRARYALGMALAAAVCACEDLVKEPILIGANAWHREFGSMNKLSIAELVAAEFPNQFRVTIRQRRDRRGSTVIEHVVVDDEDQVVPDHVTDACGMGLVVYRRWQREQKIEHAQRQQGERG